MLRSVETCARQARLTHCSPCFDCRCAHDLQPSGMANENSRAIANMERIVEFVVKKDGSALLPDALQVHGFLHATLQSKPMRRTARATPARNSKEEVEDDDDASEEAEEVGVPVEVLTKFVWGRGHRCMCQMEDGTSKLLAFKWLEARHPELLGAFEASTKPVDTSTDSAVAVTEALYHGGGHGREMVEREAALRAANEHAAEAPTFSELLRMRPTELQKVAKEWGVEEGKIHDALDAANVKATLVELILRCLKPTELKKVANEGGVEEGIIHGAFDADDVKATLVKLILAKGFAKTPAEATEASSSSTPLPHAKELEERLKRQRTLVDGGSSDGSSR